MGDFIPVAVLTGICVAIPKSSATRCQDEVTLDPETLKQASTWDGDFTHGKKLLCLEVLKTMKLVDRSFFFQRKKGTQNMVVSGVAGGDQKMGFLFWNS